VSRPSKYIRRFFTWWNYIRSVYHVIITRYVLIHLLKFITTHKHMSMPSGSVPSRYTVLTTPLKKDCVWFWAWLLSHINLVKLRKIDLIKYQSCLHFGTKVVLFSINLVKYIYFLFSITISKCTLINWSSDQCKNHCTSNVPKHRLASKGHLYVLPLSWINRFSVVLSQTF
jgi:hypothetical protein